jgi:hypothetical protein
MFAKSYKRKNPVDVKELEDKLKEETEETEEEDGEDQRIPSQEVRRTGVINENVESDSADDFLPPSTQDPRVQHEDSAEDESSKKETEGEEEQNEEEEEEEDGKEEVEEFLPLTQKPRRVKHDVIEFNSSFI